MGDFEIILKGEQTLEALDKLLEKLNEMDEKEDEWQRSLLGKQQWKT